MGSFRVFERLGRKVRTLPFPESKEDLSTETRTESSTESNTRYSLLPPASTHADAGCLMADGRWAIPQRHRPRAPGLQTTNKMAAALHEDDEVLEKNHNTDQYDEYMKLVKAKRRGQLPMMLSSSAVVPL